MALYMFQAAYTAEAVAAQIKEPRDRIEAVRASAEAIGARIIAGGYSFGEYDVVILAEGTRRRHGRQHLAGYGRRWCGPAG